MADQDNSIIFPQSVSTYDTVLNKLQAFLCNLYAFLHIILSQMEKMSIPMIHVSDVLSSPLPINVSLHVSNPLFEY